MAIPARTPFAALLVSVGAALAAGCEDRPEITSYTVEKSAPLEERPNPHDAGLPMTPPAAEPAPTGEPTDRTLAAIVPKTPQGWFFKITGPAEAVAAQEESFTTFLKMVRFVEGKPSWTLPDGWTEQPGNAFRYATIVIPGEGKSLELSVSALPNSGDDDVNYILANVNRWRGQLKLPPITATDLPQETKTLEVDGTSATLVNLAGHGGAMQPPFFSGATDGN